MNCLKSLCLIAVVLLLISCGQKDEKKTTISPKRNYGVVLYRNTAIRIDPLIFSSRVLQLKKGDVVEIIEKSKEQSWIGKTSNFWYLVKSANGISGWLYGDNIKIITSATEDSMNDFLTDFWEEESSKLKKELSGKWWSVNRFDDFTDHCLEIFDDGKYKSFLKGAEKGIEGDYSFDFQKNEIVFMKGTTFNSNLNFMRRGQSIILEKELKDREFKFKKIVESISHDEGQKKDDSEVK